MRCRGVGRVPVDGEPTASLTQKAFLRPHTASASGCFNLDSDSTTIRPAIRRRPIHQGRPLMTTSATNTIAVFGATGKQGGSLTDALLAQGANMRALVRNPESDRARILAERGVRAPRARDDRDHQCHPPPPSTWSLSILGYGWEKKRVTLGSGRNDFNNLIMHHLTTHGMLQKWRKGVGRLGKLAHARHKANAGG